MWRSSAFTALAALAVAPVAYGSINAVLIDAAINPDGSARRLPAGNTNVAITGFFQPVSLHWNPEMTHVYVAEKMGYIYKLNGFQGTKDGAQLVLDISAKVFSYGDHGLTSVWIDMRPGQNWMYVTYMLEDPRNPGITQNCQDYGQMDGRPMAEINGCITFGMFSRWALDEQGNVAGPEQVILNGLKKNGKGSYLFCSQFSTHSVTSAAQNDVDPQYMFVAGGDGAAFTNTDFGQMGTNPCLDDPLYPGAFRCQDPARMNGKVMRINLNNIVPDPDPWNVNGAMAPTPWEVYSMGHRNSWRITCQNGQVWESETGWYMYEEINKIDQGKNYGWPCTEGPYAAPHYNDPNAAGVAFHGVAACQKLMDSDNWERPFFSYVHPVPTPPSNVMSISAVMATDGFLLYGDYTQKILDKVTAGGQNDQVVLRQASPVEIRKLPDPTLAYVDYDKGEIMTLVVDGVTVPSASPSPAPVTLAVSSATQTWTANSGAQITFTANTKTFEGREGVMYEWNATLYSCVSNPNVCTQQVLVSQAKTPTISIKAPSTPGSIAVDMRLSSYGGFSMQATRYVVNAANAPSCNCNPDGNVAGGTPGGSTTKSTDASGLSTGGIIGIAVAGGAVALAIAGVGVYAVIRARRNAASPVARTAAAAAGSTARTAGTSAGNGAARGAVGNTAARGAASAGGAAGAASGAAGAAGSASDPKYKSHQPKAGLQTGEQPAATGSSAAAAPQRTPQETRA